MRALVIGNGIVGKATEAVLARGGWDCRFHDAVPERSQVPLEAAASADAVFCCVHAGGHVSKDSAITIELARACSGLMRRGSLFVQRSTCVPGTADKAAAISGLRYVVMPEFLREKFWRMDALFPGRVVLGTDEPMFDTARDLRLFACYAHGTKLHCVTRKEAELVKLLANALLALRISAWNCVRQLVSEATKEAVLGDPRLESFDVAFGEPYGGKCFPKDLDALLDYCRQEGVEAEVLRSCQEVNRRMGGA